MKRIVLLLAAMLVAALMFAGPATAGPAEKCAGAADTNDCCRKELSKDGEAKESKVKKCTKRANKMSG